MTVLEDTMNIPLCGLFLALLSFMCLDGFSIVTVNISFPCTIHILIVVVIHVIYLPAIGEK
jgi:hypothetical protein